MGMRLRSVVLGPAAGDGRVDAANLVLRVAYGAMVLGVHGVHKVREGAAFLVDGAAWPLIDEVRGMGMPLPAAGAVLATVAQALGPLLVMVGLWTRPASAMLAAVLAGAVAQNVAAHRNPELAVLYVLVAATLSIWGAGRYSLDAILFRSKP